MARLEEENRLREEMRRNEEIPIARRIEEEEDGYENNDNWN